MTECNQSRFEFATHFRREVVAEFSGGTISSDGGALLLRETDRRMNLLPRLAQCFLDGRDPALVKHEVSQMLAQRVYGWRWATRISTTTTSFVRIRSCS